jgi:hypothetical protein
MPLPFSQPHAFAAQLGYCGGRRFVAAYWDPLGDDVTVHDDRWSATGLGDRYAWSDFVYQKQIQTWLGQRDINVGNSDEEATHWLIIDRLTNDGFIASRNHGRQIIQQQRMTDVE